jgi:Ca2+-binding EF-hand superfamily protein
LYRCPVRKLKHLFNCFDIEESGTIDSQEVKWLDSIAFPPYMLTNSDKHMYQKMKQYMLEMSDDNAIVAWRRQMDKDSSMRVSYDEFRKSVKRMKLDPYFFNIEKMWNVLDANSSGWVTLSEFDTKGYELLGGFKMWSEYVFGSVTGMFYAIDKNRGGDISWKEFSGRVLGYCAQYSIDLSEDEVRYLFSGLDLSGEYKITLDEVKFLEDWDLTVDMEEIKVFPNFRLMCRGPDKFARAVLDPVEKSDDGEGENVGEVEEEPVHVPRGWRRSTTHSSGLTMPKPP